MSVFLHICNFIYKVRLNFVEILRREPKKIVILHTKTHIKQYNKHT